jgi:putative peptidoglycan lipid II flippase
MVSLAALVMGMLNAKHVFGMPAMASSFFNLGSIIGGLVFCYWLDPQTDWRHPVFGSRGLVGLSIGTLIGGFCQLIVQFPALHRVGFRFRPDFNWRDAGVRTILVLMGPATIAASAVQVNVAVNSGFASALEDGSMAYLNIAFRLMQLPLGIFGVAVGTVTLPLVSRCAATGDIPGFRSALSHALRLVMVLTVPAAIGLFMLARPVIGLIYEHGKFDARATEQTAVALQFYALGLVGYSAIKVLAPAFYALDKKYLPMVVSILSIALNFVLNWFFLFRLKFDHRGLALGTSIVAVTNFLILYIMMRRYAGRLETGALLKTLVKLSVAGGLLAGVCWIASQLLFMPGSHIPIWKKTAEVGAAVTAGAVVFFGAAFVLRISEVGEVVELLGRKFRKSTP